MADKTTGELQKVKVEELPAAPDIYDDFKMPGELQGGAVHVTGAQMKDYAREAGETAAAEFAGSVAASAQAAEDAAYKANRAKNAAQSALVGVSEALSNLPEGDALIINDLTTGGAGAALSAEMGRVLAERDTENLLDNSDLTNAVNQRGYTLYTENKADYCIDRWVRAQKLTVEVTRGGVVLTNTGAVMNGFYQLVDPDKRLSAGDVVTLACEDGDGNIYVGSGEIPAADYANLVNVGNYAYGRIYAPDESGLIRAQLSVRVEQSFTLRWMALYQGAYTSETLPPFRPRGYSEELRRCQRYFQVVNPQRKVGGHLLEVRARTASEAVGTLILPVPMRAVPAVSISGASANVEISGEYSFAVVPAADIAVNGDNCDTARLRLKATINNADHPFTAGEWYSITAADSGVSDAVTALHLDAEL